MTDDRDEVVLPSHLDAKHGEARLGVMERHALHEPRQHLRRCVRYVHPLRPGLLTPSATVHHASQFVGFMAAYRDSGALPPMLAGTLGGLITTLVTFTPCFLWIFLGAPFVEALRGNKALSGA